LIGVAAWQLDLRLAVLALPLILLVVIATRAWVARLAWATDDERLAIRKGWVDRQVGIVRFSRIQALSLRQSPFDRRWRMATLHVDTAGTGGAGVRLTLPFLPEAEARELFERLHREVSARDFVWN
ncbi:MAG: PH domain-containing protein, partial [Planctomycetota bacterium]